MSVYHQVRCSRCAEALSFGKAILRDQALALRLFSESEQAWLDDDRCWKAMQLFRWRHKGHELSFEDDASKQAQEAAEVDVDALLATHERSTGLGTRE